MDQTLNRVAALVNAGDVETRCAALVVLTQLASDEDAVVKAVAQSLGGPNVVVQDFALTYFEQVRPKSALPLLLPLLDAEEDDTRRRAAALVAAYGAGAVAAVKKLRQPDAPRRRLNAIIDIAARVRTAAAYDLLFQIMAEGDFETNRLAGEALEGVIRELDAGHRADLYARVDAFATAMKTNRVPLVSALKLFGALGDPRCRKRLAGLLHREEPHSVRTHAMSALLHCLRGETLTAAEIEVLLGVLDEDDEQGILRPAILLLEDQQLDRKYLERLHQLAESPQASVKRFAVHKLGAFDSGAVVKTLMGYLTDDSYARRAEAAAGLKKTAGARLPLMKEFLACDDERKAWTLADILLAHDRNWRKDVRDQLWEKLAEAVDEREDRLYSAYFEFLRQLDEGQLLERVRDRGEKLRQKKKYPEAARWLALLRDGPAFDDEARYALSLADLKSRKHTLAAPVRRHDAALDLLRDLGRRGFPVAERLRKERALIPEELLYVGFTFAEGTVEERPIGSDILRHVAGKFARTNAGKAAKNKLRLLERAVAV
jgi:HEAT repeat protein